MNGLDLMFVRGGGGCVYVIYFVILHRINY